MKLKEQTTFGYKMRLLRMFRVEHFYEFAEYECFCCSRLFYEEGVISGNSASNIHVELINIAAEIKTKIFICEELPSRIYFCHSFSLLI